MKLQVFTKPTYTLCLDCGKPVLSEQDEEQPQDYISLNYCSHCQVKQLSKRIKKTGACSNCDQFLWNGVKEEDCPNCEYLKIKEINDQKHEEWKKEYAEWKRLRNIPTIEF